MLIQTSTIFPIPLLILLPASTQALNLPQNTSNIFPSTTYNLSTTEETLISTLNTTTTPPSSPPLLNLTTPILPSPSNELEVQCKFGHDLTYNSCLDALNQFSYPPDRYLTIGTRMPGLAKWDLELPVRWMSGDGYCTLDLIKRQQTQSSLATGDEIKAAAAVLINECVLRGNGQGGVVFKIGPNRDIGLILRPNIPRNVECYDDREYPYHDYCNELEQSLPAASSQLITFGPEGWLGIQEVLPKVWMSKFPNGCIAAVSASSKATDVVDTSTYYDLWQAFVTLKAMCVRYNKMGKISGLGTAGKMTMDVLPFDWYASS